MGRIQTIVQTLFKRSAPNRLEKESPSNKLSKSAQWWQLFLQSTSNEEIDHIVSGLSPLNLATLDHHMREWCTHAWYVRHNWQYLQPADIATLAKSKFASTLVGLASFHQNGYIREAAVRELASQHTGAELPFLLIRLNDWVPQVRELAANAVRDRIEPAYASHFLATISLVLRLRVWGRVDKQFLDDICDLLRRPECKDLLLSGMTSKDRHIRKLSFQLAAESDSSTRASIIGTLLTARDAFARSWAVRHFLTEVPPDDLPGIIQPLLTDRYLPIRRDALWQLATKRPDLAAEPLQAALLDDDSFMRDIARQFPQIANIPDLRVFYIEAIGRVQDRQLPAAICGLGETGQAGDANQVILFLGSQVTKLRRAAVNALGRLDGSGHLGTLIQCLSDETPGISKEALKALLPMARQISLEQLEERLTSKMAFHVRRNTLTLVVHSGKWRKLPGLLNACADNDARIVGLARKRAAQLVLKLQPELCRTNPDRLRMYFVCPEKKRGETASWCGK